MKSLEKEDNSYTHVLKYAGIFGGVQGLNLLIGVIRNKLVAILLGPTGMGLNSLFITVQNFISQATTFGISFSAVKHISELFDEGDEQKISHFVRVIRSWTFLTALIGMFVCISLGPLLSDYTFTWGDHTLHFILLAPAVAMIAIMGGEMAILKGLRQLKALAVIQLFSVLILFCISIPVFYFFGEAGIVPVIVISAFVGMMNCIYFTRKHFPFRWRGLFGCLGEGLTMVRLGVAYTMAGILGSGAEMLVRSYLNIQGDLDTVGFYSSGYVLIVTYTSMVFSAMETDYFPRLSAVHHDIAATNQIVNRQMEVSILLISPILTVFIIALPILVPLLYTDSFMPVVSMAQLATFAMYAKAISLPLGYVSLSKGDSRTYLLLESMYDVLLVVGILVGYHFLNLTGTGLALAIIHAVELLVLVAYIHHRYHYSMSSSVVRYALIQVPIGLLTLLVSYLCEGWTYWLLSLLCIAASGAVSIYILHQKTSLWLSLKEKIKSKFRKV